MTFDKVPSEIFQQVLADLSLLDLVRIGKVNRWCQKSIQLENLWRKILERDNENMCFLLKQETNESFRMYYKKLHLIPDRLKALHKELVDFGKLLPELIQPRDIDAVKVLDLVIHRRLIFPSLVRIEVHCQKLGLNETMEDSGFKVLKYGYDPVNNVQISDLFSIDQAFLILHKSIVYEHGNVVALATSKLLVPVHVRQKMKNTRDLRNYVSVMNVKFDHISQTGVPVEGSNFYEVD